VYIPPVMTMFMIAWINVRISDRQQMLEDLTQLQKKLGLMTNRPLSQVTKQTSKSPSIILCKSRRP
jgi:positive regulator of sigma E activity